MGVLGLCSIGVAACTRGDAREPPTAQSEPVIREGYTRTTFPLGGEARGVSAAATDDQGRLWVVEERQHQLLLLEESAGWRVARTYNLVGLPQRRTDVEALSWISENTFALGTEDLREGRPSDTIYWVELQNDRAVVTQELELPYALWSTSGERNRGIEGLCSSGDWLVAGVEKVLERAGQRLAPLALWHAPTGRWMPYLLILTTSSGKLSALDCRMQEDRLELMAIERHYGVGELLRFAISLPKVPPEDEEAGEPRLVKAQRVTALFQEGEPQPNYEGIVLSPDGRLVLLADNDTGGVSGPTMVLVMEPTPAPGL